MKITRNLCFIYYLLHVSFIYPRPLDNPISQFQIKDCLGDIEVRALVSPSWEPIFSGINIPAKCFIRLNTPNSILSLRLPDESLLRLIGITSIFIDYISRPKNNTHQTKILLLSGRWFYSATLNQPSRIIVNTDLTTSIIENGSGGGFFLSGMNEFMIRSGRGLISYRKPDIKALVLDENQMITFDIYEGFNNPKLVTDSAFNSYLIFQDPTNQEQNSPPLLLQNTDIPEDIQNKISETPTDINIEYIMKN